MYDTCVNSVLSDLKIRAENGEADALFEQGILLFYGHCMKKDTFAGLSNLRDAVSQGHIEAAFYLGEIYADKTLRKIHNPLKKILICY